MAVVIRLPDPVCDRPGCWSCMQLPRLRGVVRSIVVMGRPARDIEELSLRVNGCELLRFGRATVEDGESVSGGELAQLVAQLLGPIQHRGVVLDFGDGLDLQGVSAAELCILIGGNAGMVGRVQCFAFVRVFEPAA